MTTIARLQNFKLKNKSISTSAGVFSFNNEGIILASKLPKELLDNLCGLEGFKPLDKNGNEIVLSDEPDDSTDIVPEPVEPKITDEKPGDTVKNPASK